jgi:hypothetical protein
MVCFRDSVESKKITAILSKETVDGINDFATMKSRLGVIKIAG